jgi:hypothetical protein
VRWGGVEKERDIVLIRYSSANISKQYPSPSPQDDIGKYSSPTVTVTTNYLNILTKKMEFLQVVNSVHVTKSRNLDLSTCD